MVISSSRTPRDKISTATSNVFEVELFSGVVNLVTRSYVDDLVKSVIECICSH